ncbi:hypothetical protein ACJMK2_033004 [Sinanodonta woodiana]|uniref:Uncharacterized protein n=1 Tax=Sinanodonta woodiana TaxID=1069815 RepID=A0ABD3X727_SINWO
MTVYDDKGGYPKKKDIWQDREGNVVIFPGGDRLWVGFGTPRRQLEFAYKYRNDGIEKAHKNRPLIRSFLVDSKVAIQIMENAVPESFSSKGLDINVDQKESPNQFGLREQSAELLRQNALSGSLVTYYMDEESLLNDKTTAWGIVKPIDDLRKRLSYPDPGDTIYDTQEIQYPSHMSDRERKYLVALKDIYDTYVNNLYDREQFAKLNDFYNEYVKRGGSKSFHEFYKTTVPSWAAQAEIQHVIEDIWKSEMHTENTLAYFRQKVLDINQDIISDKGGIDELEQRSQQHKQNLERRNKMVVLYEEVNAFLTMEVDRSIGRFKQAFWKQLKSRKWKDFSVGADVTVEILDSFKTELSQHLQQIKETYAKATHLPDEKLSKLRSQVNKFIDTLDQGLEHEKLIVITVGNKNDENNVDTFSNYHIDDLNENLAFPSVVANNVVIDFVDLTSKEEASTSTSKLTAEGISKFIKRNFICQSIDQIHVESPSLQQKEDVILFLNTLATNLRQKGEGYDERVVETNQCSSYNSKYERVVFFPELQYVWSEDTQGTLLIFDKGKYELYGIPVDHTENLFPNLDEKINDQLISLKAQQFSGTEIIKTLFSTGDKKLVKKAAVEIAKKEEQLRKSQQGKDISLKDSAKDEMNRLIKESLCQSSSRRKRATCEFKETDIDIVEESVEVVDDRIKFQVYEKNNPAIIHEIINDLPPSIKSLTTRQHTVMSKIHLGLGTHGAVLNFIGALHYFQVGDNARGGFSLFQSLHAVGQLSGLNERIAYRISESVAGRVINKFLQKTSTKVASLLFKSEKMAEKAVSSFEHLTSSTSIIGIAFSIYFIEEDINNLVENKDDELIPLYAIDLALDITIAVLAVDPIFEPVVLALSLVRMVLDDIYMDFLDEWKRAKGKGVLEHVFAVIIGIIDGLEDFITLGLTRQMRQLSRQEETYREFLKNLSNIENYFQVSGGKDGFSQLDLNAGEDFAYGGLVSVRLFDNNTFEIEIEAVPTISGLTTLKRLFSGNIKDIILGIGESLDLVNYGMTSAKLLIFPVKSYHTFEFKPINSSSFGRYFGNKYSNTFAAIQGNHSRTQESQCHDTVIQSNVSMQLERISYYITGKDGDDIFLLGPESFHLDGGRGHDSYFIPWYGGLTVIENFAEDAAVDSLFINVSYNVVHCDRHKDDLHVQYCGERTVVVQNWFGSTARTFHQHLRIITNDGVTLEPFETNIENNSIDCYPTYVDLSHKTEGNIIDLSQLSFQHVARIVGSNFTDVITGNQIGNVLNGGLGEDILTGGDGDDVYVISSGEGCDVINITALDKSTERIIFDAVYNNIEIGMKSSQEVEVFDNTDRLKTCFSIVDINKFSGEQQLLIVTADNYIFEIKYNEQTGELENTPVILDFSLSDKPVSINLIAPDSGDMPMKDAARIITVIDSKHSDHVVANNADNFLSCSGGKLDYLEGRGGQDTYVIQKECSNVHIFNFDLSEKWDRMIIKAEYSSLHLDLMSDDSVVIRSADITIVLLNWYVNSTYQHLVFETEDGVTCSIPTSKEELIPSMNMLPYEIRFTEKSCKGVSHTSLDLNKDPWKNVAKIVARPTLCLCSVTGNALANYIDLGPTNVTERRYMAGGNGSDTYVVEYGYGSFNEISNFAKDEKLDHMLLGILYYDVEISVIADDMIITSSSHPESVGVRLLNFMSGDIYQHLIATTSDGITMKIEPAFPHKIVLVVDKSYSSYSVRINNNTHPDLMTAKRITGSMLEKNYIEGGDATVYISGGEQNDTLHGGISGENINGLEGSDCIYGHNGNDILIGGPGDDLLKGGEGDDTLYGGDGADSIHGGTGSNTVVFKGDGLNQAGVYVNLQTGQGEKADAEGDTYEDIQNIYGSEYNDILHGNDQDNIINGFQGTDYIHPYGSNDMLIGGPGNDVYNCSDATGRKEIWLDGDLNYIDLIIVDKNTMNDICYFVIEDNLVITQTTSRPNTDRLELFIMNFTATKALNNFNLQIGTYSHESKFADAYSVNYDIQLFKRQSWMHVLDVSDNEIILLLNGSFIQHYIGGNLDLRLLLSYSSNSSVNVTEINTKPYNGSDLIIVSDLLAGIEYTLSLSLLKCHTEIVSAIVKQYTLPLPPSNLKVSDIMSDSFTVKWTLPEQLGTNYSFECYVNSTDGTYSFMYTIKKPMIIIQSLEPHTDYEVRIRSVVSMYISEYSVPLHVRTNATCKNIKPPQDGYKESKVRTEKGHQVKMACKKGFELIGDDTVICDDGKTVGNQICSQKRCPIPERFNSHADITWYKASPSSEWKVTWECKRGFEIDPWKTIHTAICRKGQWKSELLPCIPIVRCPAPMAPINGKIYIPSSMSSGFRNKASIDVSCNSGFAIEGPTKIICVGSSWTELPKCIKVFCPSPPQVDHGHYQYISDSYKRDRAEQNDTAVLICDLYHIPEEWNSVKIIDYLKGIVVDADNIVCDEGKWIRKVQNCVPTAELVNKEEYIFHVRGYAKLTPKITWDQLDVYTTETVLSNICNNMGLTYAGDSDNAIICKRSVTLKGITQYEGVPFIMVENTWQAICIYSHHLSVAEDFCQHMSFSGHTVDVYKSESFTAIYEVRQTFEHEHPLLHKVETSCDTYLRCRGKCPTPYIHNAKDCDDDVSHEKNKIWWLEGETCFIKCDSGYVRFGSESITCTADGSWSENPTCTEQVLETKEVYEGYDLTFSCSEGQYVKIVSANYQGVCQEYFILIPFYGLYYVRLLERCGRACEFNDVTDKVIAQCSHKIKCSIPAANYIFGDPCPGLWKMLKVKAVCDNN